MRKISWILMLSAALGLGALAEPAAVELVPAAKEVQAMQEAWAQVIEFFEEFITEIKGAVETLAKNDQDISTKYRAVAVQLKDLEAKLLQIQETFAQKSTGLEKGLAECSAKITELRKASEELASGYKAADADLEARIHKALKELGQSLEVAIASCQKSAAVLEQKLGALAGQVQEIQKRVEVLESYDIGNLARRVLSLEQAIQVVQAKIENNREKISALEKTMGGFAADIASLKESVLSLQTLVGDHEASIAAMKEAMGTNIQDLSARLDAIQALSILGLLAGIGAILLLLLGLGG